jgi:oxygen-independent coproporphyrinogen-3 oxidase
MNAHERHSALPPLSLYIHIPWCVRKCPYCDFNSHTIKSQTTTADKHSTEADKHSTDTLPEAAYIDALIEDLKADMDQAQGRRLQSIFFWGGTTTLL